MPLPLLWVSRENKEKREWRMDSAGRHEVILAVLLHREVAR